MSVPIRVVFGDHLDAPTGMPGFSWRSAYDDCRAFVARVNVGRRHRRRGRGAGAAAGRRGRRAIDPLFAAEGGARAAGEEVHPGDVVWFAPGEKHWHGAAATTAMTHIAMQEALDGKAVDWLEHVADAEYEQGPPSRPGSRAD